MRAAVVTEIGAPFTVMEVALAAPERREVVVDVRASGLCRSDHTVATKGVGFALPSVLGHEVAGVVADVGSDVTDFAPGDHVVGCVISFCGRCDRCVSGKVYLCRRPEFTHRPRGAAPRLSRPDLQLDQGFGLGGFAEQILVHENLLTKIPAEVPFAQASVIGCSVVTGAGAVLNSARVRPGETVVILGAGGVGLNAVQGAVIAGASRIIVSDIHTMKLQQAEMFGATDVVDASAVDPVEAVKRLLHHGADHVFDFVGARSVTAQALEMVDSGGGLYLIGTDAKNPGIDIDSEALMYRHAKIQGVGMGSSHPRRDIPLYAGLYLQGRLRLDELVSRTISLDQINEGYEAMADGTVARIVITDFD